MSWSTTLLTYASYSSPSTQIPRKEYLDHTSRFILIGDLYPKSTFHWLILPRLPFPLKDGSTLQASQLEDIRTILSLEKSIAMEVLEGLEEMLEIVKGRMRVKMKEELDGFEWDICNGFHPIPSMRHLHLHVYSKDLVSPFLKKPKHYQAFNPSLGYSLPLETVKGWLIDNDTKLLVIDAPHYQALLDSEMKSFYCSLTYKSVTRLKEDLEEEFEYLEVVSIASRKKLLAASTVDP